MGLRKELRGRLKQLPGARSTYYLGMALQQMLMDEWQHPDSFNRVFRDSHDPWNLDENLERQRFELSLDVLGAAETSRFGTALELGCAEGIFTEQLATRCGSLEAVDFSDIALERARARLAGIHSVRFSHWDIRTQDVAGSYDLITAMGVIAYVFRPRKVRQICQSITRSLEPGGYFLYSDVRQTRVFETAWWGKAMLRGGEQIRRHLNRVDDLELVRGADTDSHVFALYRRRTKR